MIDWARYFDHIYSIGYVKNDITKLNSELKRIGIYDSGIYSHEYSHSNIFVDSILQCILRNDMDKYEEDHKGFDVSLTHYKIIKEAYELGYNKILIIEDDSIFLKDINRIEEILNNLPNDYELCYLNWTLYHQENAEIYDYNDYFKYFKTNNDIWLFSASSYTLNRDTMLNIINFYEDILIDYNKTITTNFNNLNNIKLLNIDVVLCVMTNFNNTYLSNELISIQKTNNEYIDKNIEMYNL